LSHVFRLSWKQLPSKYSIVRRLLRAEIAARQLLAEDAKTLDFKSDRSEVLYWLPIFDTIAQASGYPLKWLLALLPRVFSSVSCLRPKSRRMSTHAYLNRNILCSVIRRLRNWIREEGLR